MVEVEDTRVRMRHGLLRGQRVHATGARVRVGLVATQALLLGGDGVELEVWVGPDASLDLFDVAGTVAHHGRGRPASWTTILRVGAGGRLSYAGEPFVVADGADITRRMIIDLDDAASARIRETVILGRHGEVGGRLRNLTTIRRCGREVLVEDQHLGPERRSPGLLGDLRVLDTVIALEQPSLAQPPPEQPAGDGVRYALTEPGASLTRYLGTGLAESPLR